ncbi:MAG: electron transfer flavoprotein subunit alpha/FixB family protein, partial [Spirochaetia bacterium]|nr:electron transfer flavoprotein subunit alpha/FixB family protein [Spirochaetia bacterium]
ISGNLDSVEVKKPIYSGKAFAKIKAASPAVLTVRPNSQEVISHTGSETIESSSASEGDVASKLTDLDLDAGTNVQLGDASIIVSGGRGIKGPENWPLLQELCDVLGAALGASRAAVDAGWISHSNQVGQTGKTVSPNCYIACGISGAIQHLAGMSSSKYIVAVNKDPEAPIFKVATYGIVDDLFEIVPALTAEFKKVLG